MIGVEKVTKMGIGNLFQVKHYDGVKYEATAEHAAAIVVDRMKEVSTLEAGLHFLSRSVNDRAIPNKDFDDWAFNGLVGLLKGLEALAASIDLETRDSLKILDEFSNGHNEGHD